ncbi:MAG: ankyrin repeat domain-containing protein, partial [Campylobacterales bacterium]|nr:ankyrin repeat domain-containing protein [Campylobacterales bacterium]
MKKILLILFLFCSALLADDSSQKFLDFNLHRFAYIGDLAKVQKALNMGAKIDSLDDEGMSALQWAAYKDRADVVKYLIKNGANKGFKSQSGKNILTYAVQNKDTALVKYMLENGVPLEEFSTNTNALCVAVEQGDEATVGVLLPYFKNINSYYTNNAGDMSWETNTTLLLSAINAKSQNLAKLFISKGADINKPNSRGETPLLCAMRNRMYELAILLIDKGAA